MVTPEIYLGKLVLETSQSFSQAHCKWSLSKPFMVMPNSVIIACFTAVGSDGGAVGLAAEEPVGES